MINPITNRHFTEMLCSLNVFICHYDGIEKQNKWIQPGRKDAIILEDLCLNKRLRSDVAKLLLE